jgi:hypothetical protein
VDRKYVSSSYPGRFSSRKEALRCQLGGSRVGLRSVGNRTALPMSGIKSRTPSLLSILTEKSKIQFWNFKTNTKALTDDPSLIRKESQETIKLKKIN